MDTRLVGTRDWDPTGESFWGVLSKLCARNHMNWDEARGVMGGRQGRAVTTDTGRDPDEFRNVSLERTRELTGWSESQVLSGFSVYYQPYWMKHLSESKVPLSRSIRLCHDCAMAGIHLTVHQFIDWTHCPIHKTRLRSTCPKCDEELGHFQLTADFPDRTPCSQCQWALWDSNLLAEADNGVARTTFIVDYLDWQQRIQQYFRPDTGRRMWYGDPSRYGQLAHAHALVPGPECISRCLVNADRIKARHVSYAIQYPEADDPVKCEPEQTLLDFGDEPGKPNSASPCDTYMQLMIGVIHRTKKELERRHPTRADRSGVSEISSTRCVVQHGPQISCWATAHWLWRRCFDEAWPAEERWSRVRQKTPLVNTEFCRLWTGAFSHLFVPGDSCDHCSPSDLSRISLSQAWLGCWLESIYYAFATLSCHATDLQALNSCTLVKALHELECLPLFAVRDNRFSSSLVSLSAMEEPEFFVTLHGKGFKGNDETLLNDFRKLSPILSGVGLHPETKRSWQVDSRRLRAARDALRSRLK